MRKNILVVGGGASGLAVAYHLAKEVVLKQTALTVTVAEGAAELGLGVAYGTPSANHILNVRARSMSVDPESPNSYFDWLSRAGLDYLPRSFTARNIYPRYLREMLRLAIEEAGDLIVVEHLRQEVLGLSRSDAGGYTACFSNGEVSQFRGVVLALGNLPSRREFFAEIDASRVLFPWQIAELPSPSSTVLLFGAGLTAVDAIVDLERRGFGGNFIAVSRRGHLPLTHAGADEHPSAEDERFIEQEILGCQSIRLVLRRIRSRAEAGCSWRMMLEALRNKTENLWSGLPLAEKQRFMRHLRPYWEIHRHRVPTESSEILERLIKAGRLRVMPRRISRVGCREDGRIVATLTNKDSTEVVTGDLAVNCLGLAPNIKAARSALLDDLLDRGLVCPNQLGLGLLVSSNGEVCDRQGLPAKNLFTLGSMRRGELAETTSMPDIRVQAQQVARALVSSI